MITREAGPLDHSDCETISDVNDSGPIDILIADDESIVRRILEMALRPLGVRVRTADNGAEAVRLFQQHRGEVSLVLLDVQMPELNGPQAFRELRAMDPLARILFMSGGPGEYTVDDLLGMGAIGFVEKPFPNLTALSRRLVRLLELDRAQTL